MSLAPGARLGPYEVTAQIGAGGMGEVYRATDTNLRRAVAIKILPAVVAGDPERLARFQREAEVLAALNHPNIATIHGLEKSGITALVMELVEGPTLADRIAQGALPIDQALPIAKQIAEALDAAHQAGIIHRDLKPANVKVRDDGTVKVLDFGLAKAFEPIAAGSIATSPTITSPAMMTGIGVLLGTAAYMSPEQARGKPVDRRADIWAFGCVLYEMLTGRRAFDGEDVSLTLSQILQREPDLDALPGDAPPHVRRAVHLCLRKPLKERLTDMGALRLLLEGAFETPAAPSTTHATVAPPAWRRAVPFVLTALAAAIVGGMSVWLSDVRVLDPRPVVRFALPASTAISPRGVGVGRHVLAISPNGTHLVYWGGKLLHLRALDRLDDDIPLRGTDGAREPFFSPDGQWIGFLLDGQLKRMPVGGGAPIALGAAQNPWGASWSSDDVIRYGQGSDGIWQVSPSGGAPAQLITLAKGELAHGPQLLPGGDWVLFTFSPASTDSWDEAQIVLQSPASGQRIVLIEHGRDARYLPTGHIVYGLNGVLLAVPFDVRARRVTGPAVPVVESVMDADVRTGAMHFTVSDNGTLAYLSGASGERSTLAWVYRNGRREPLPAEALPYSFARVSPDGTRIAVEITGSDGISIHIGDLVRGTFTRLTSGPMQGRAPLWTPDSQRVVFYSETDGGGLYSMAADTTGSVRRLTTSRALQTPYSWADGGRSLLFEERPMGRLGSADIYLLRIAGEPAATPLIHTADGEVEPAVSPDGKWLAYTLTGAFSQEVYVRPFPQVDNGRWRISTSGGSQPLWSPDGRKLFFAAPGGAMSVSVDAAPTFRAGTPTVMFELPTFYSSGGRIGRQWDIAPDGERFLVMNPGEVAAGERSPSRIVVVLNWFEELKRLVPTQ